MRMTGSTASRNKLFPTMKTRRTVAAMSADFQEGLDLGAYIGNHRRSQPAGIECPYCHLEMIEAQPIEPPGRIIRVIKRLRTEFNVQRADVIVEEIPATHRVVACRECRCVFTSPKSVDAVDPSAGTQES